MRRFLLWTLVILLAVAALAAVGLHEAYRALQGDRLKTIIESAASDYLGRKLTVERLERASLQKMELDGWNVRLEDARGRVIVDCPRVHARASFLSLLHLRLGVDEIAFLNPRIHVWYEKNGLTNVETIVDEINRRPSSGMRGKVGALFFQRFAVRGGRLTISADGGATPILKDLRTDGTIDLKVSPLAIKAPFELSLDGGDAAPRL
ncbi:MAG: hypothetical protein JO102_00585, partial [Elusimicrobia bacterium]|nr:hypothetical protein [Elusimicrobiota bacterium]